MNMFRKDEFDTGEMLDGHKLLRNVCDEDGIDVVHPATCEPGHDFGYRSSCSWSVALEMFDSVLDAHDQGRESPALADLDVTLPRGVEVPVAWRYSGGANWTDYGWEYDAEFSWWFVSESST